MNVCTAATGSMTMAIKARQSLADAGINSEIVKLDPSSARRGCEYGVSYGCGDQDAVKRAFFRAGVRPVRYIKGGGELI